MVTKSKDFLNLKGLPLLWASQVALVVKNPPAGVGDAGLIPGSGRSPGGGMATPSSMLAWKIPWAKEPSWWATVHGVVKSQT